MIGPALAAARDRVPPGRCAFCRRRIATGMKCSRPPCKRAYWKLWARDNRASSTIRKVVKRTPSPFNPRRRVDALSCGHGVEVRGTSGRNVTLAPSTVR